MFDLRPAITFNGQRCLIEAMPRIFRLTNYRPIRINDWLTCCTATLYHRHLTLKVVWSVRTPDPELRTSELVSIRWPRLSAHHAGETGVGEEDGVLPIERLIPATDPDAHTNLFDTLPPTWPVDPCLIEHGRTLIRALPRRFQHLFNAILWDGQRFLRYVTGPTSLDRAHNQLNGNLRHSLDVAENALERAKVAPPVFLPLLILGSLLHDAGKADRYTLDLVRLRFVDVERPGQDGHRARLLDWVSEALETLPTPLPRPHELALYELFTSVGGASRWSRYDLDGASLETQLVAQADRWSMQRGAVQESTSSRPCANDPGQTPDTSWACRP